MFNNSSSFSSGGFNPSMGFGASSGVGEQLQQLQQLQQAQQQIGQMIKQQIDNIIRSMLSQAFGNSSGAQRSGGGCSGPQSNGSKLQADASRLLADEMQMQADMQGAGGQQPFGFGGGQGGGGGCGGGPQFGGPGPAMGGFGGGPQFGGPGPAMGGFGGGPQFGGPGPAMGGFGGGPQVGGNNFTDGLNLGGEGQGLHLVKLSSNKGSIQLMADNQDNLYNHHGQSVGKIKPDGSVMFDNGASDEAKRLGGNGQTGKLDLSAQSVEVSAGDLPGADRRR